MIIEDKILASSSPRPRSPTSRKDRERTTMSRPPRNRKQAIELLERTARIGPRSSSLRAIHSFTRRCRDDPPRRAKLGHFQPAAQRSHRFFSDRSQRRRPNIIVAQLLVSGKRRPGQGRPALRQLARRRRYGRARTSTPCSTCGTPVSTICIGQAASMGAFSWRPAEGKTLRSAERTHHDPSSRWAAARTGHRTSKFKRAKSGT